MVICNVDPDIGYIYGAGFSWSELKLVKDPLLLNILLGFTIGLGWISFLLDFILAWCKAHDWRSYNWGPLTKAVIWFVDDDEGEDVGFWARAVPLEGLQYIMKTKPTVWVWAE